MDTKTGQTRAEVKKYLANKAEISSIYGMFVDMESSYPGDQVREMTPPQYSDTDSIRIRKE